MQQRIRSEIYVCLGKFESKKRWRFVGFTDSTLSVKLRSFERFYKGGFIGENNTNETLVNVGLRLILVFLTISPSSPFNHIGRLPLQRKHSQPRVHEGGSGTNPWGNVRVNSIHDNWIRSMIVPNTFFIKLMGLPNPL